MLSRTSRINLEILLIENDGSHLVIPSMINGKQARLLIDTGASRTVFDQERIKFFLNDESFIIHDKLSTGLGTNTMPTSGVELKALTLGKLTIKNFEAVLLDLKHVNETYNNLGYASIDGVIGNDILVKHNALINYRKKSLTLDLKIS